MTQHTRTTSRAAGPAHTAAPTLSVLSARAAYARYTPRHAKVSERRARTTGFALAAATVASLAAAPAVIPAAAADPAGCVANAQGVGNAYSCTVHSPSMNRDFNVIVRPGTTGKVAQFLDGADSTDVNAWATAGGALQALAGNTDTTLVFPAMDRFSWAQDWDQSKQFETFLTQELPDYLQNTWGIAGGGRNGNTGVTGLSSGAYGAMNLAAKHPDMYSSVYALSGLYDPTMPVQAAVIDGTATVNNGEFGPYSDPVDQAQNSPTLNIGNLTMPVIVSASTGIPNFAGDMGPDPVATVVKGGPFETGSMVFTAEFQARALLAGRTNIQFKYDLIGAHAWDTWRNSAFKEGNMAQFLANIGGGQAPGPLEQLTSTIQPGDIDA